MNDDKAMNADEKALDRLIGFVNRQVGKSWWLTDELNQSTRILEDLRVDGDDAVDFFLAFGNEFDVDLSKFELAKYFNSEGFDPIGISALFYRIVGRKASPDNNRSSRVSINLGHLLRAIEWGRLDSFLIEEDAPGF